MLAKGLNYAQAPSRIPIPEIIAAVEVGLSKASSTQAQLARMRITGQLTKTRPPPTNLHPEEQKAIKSLKQANSIVITKADKGNATVVMDRDDYYGKIRALLADAGTYKRLPKDPTPALERRMNALLLALTRSDAISSGPLYDRLRSSAPLRTTKGPQTGDPPTSNCLIHWLPDLQPLKASGHHSIPPGW